MTYPFRPQMPPYPFVPPFDPPDEEPPYIPPDSSTSGDEPDGSSSVDPGPRPDWWPDDWEWPPEPEEPIEVLVPPPLPNIIWPRLPPHHPYHLPPGYHYPDNLPPDHPGQLCQISATTSEKHQLHCRTVDADRTGYCDHAGLVSDRWD